MILPSRTTIDRLPLNLFYTLKYAFEIFQIFHEFQIHCINSDEAVIYTLFCPTNPTARTNRTRIAYPKGIPSRLLSHVGCIYLRTLIRNRLILVKPLLVNLRVFDRGDHVVDPPVLTRMFVDVGLPLDSLGIKDRPHDGVRLGNELGPFVLVRKLSDGMVDVKKDGTGRGLPAAVEAAFAVLVEEDVDEEAEDATADIEIGNIFSDGALFLFGEGSGGSSKVQRGMIAVMKAWKSLEGLFLMMFE